MLENENICILPFINLDRNADHDISPPAPSPCCYYEHQTAPKHNLEDYFTSTEIQEVRHQMLNGEKPPGCWKCWHEESLGKKSMRQSVNESRLDEHLDHLQKQPVAPTQIKMLAGSSCNLACRMCQSHVSSRVSTVWQAIGRKVYPQYQYDTQADEYIRKHSSELKYIDLMGGEPLYHKNIIKLLRFLVDTNASNHITLFLTTNGMLVSDHICELLSKFKKVVAIFSIDAVGEKHEYIRPGSDWNVIFTNMQKIRNYKNIDVLVQPTISVLNIIHIPELDQWCQQNDFHMTQKVAIYDPPELNPKQLPEQIRHLVKSPYTKFLDNKTEPCVPFIKQMDSYWNTDITKIMLEWQDVFNSIELDSMEKDYILFDKTKKFLTNESI